MKVFKDDKQRRRGRGRRRRRYQLERKMISVNDVVYENDKVSKWWISKPSELCGCYLGIGKWYR